MPGQRQPALAVALQQEYRSDHQIVLGHVRCGFVTAAAMHDQGAQAEAKRAASHCQLPTG